MQTRLTRNFEIEFPIISAPMGLVAGGKLAKAVTVAGGLGFIGGGYAGILGGEPDLATELEIVKGEKFGIGFITWALEKVPRILDEVLEYKPHSVFLSFGSPKPFAKKIVDAKAKLICQAQTLEHVKAALGVGANVIVAQGTEAGGHGGKRATFPFVPEVADYLAANSPETLLLAAGGIADGRGLAAALMLGADGVVIGSRFWAAEESLTPDPAVNKAIKANGDQTVRTTALDSIRGVPWPDEFSFRVVKNSLTDEWENRESEAKENFGCFSKPYAEARKKEDFDTVAIVAGEAVGLIRSRATAKEIIDNIVKETQNRLDLAKKMF